MNNTPIEKDNICYPFVAGGLETTLLHIITNGFPGVTITDKDAYNKAITAKIASIKEMSKEYSR
jgi:hypothetical protein